MSGVLLDTHVLYWAAAEPRRLSRAAQRAVRTNARAGEAFVSCVTLYELAGMLRRGQIRSGSPPQAAIEEIVDAVGAGIHDITAEIAAIAQYFPEHFPPDPMDRVIAATAIARGVPLVTKDERITDSGLLRTIW